MVKVTRSSVADAAKPSENAQMVGKRLTRASVEPVATRDSASVRSKYTEPSSSDDIDLYSSDDDVPPSKLAKYDPPTRSSAVKPVFKNVDTSFVDLINSSSTSDDTNSLVDNISKHSHLKGSAKVGKLTRSSRSKSPDKNVEVLESSDFEESDDIDLTHNVRSPMKEGKKNTIQMYEVERAAVDRLANLSKYRKIFEPFVTPKVMSQLNNVLIEKQKQSNTANNLSNRDEDTIRISQPSVLAPVCKMREYQLEGFSWLVHNYNRSINCILADEMGLGKTLQSIACIAQLALVQKLPGPYLFVVPLSVLFNWMNEFKKWCPALRVLRLHSTDKDEQLRLRKQLHHPSTQIVVTTYDAVKQGGLSHALHTVVWRSVFLDEGHRIKNEHSDVSKACHALRTRFRVVLTGTPVQNNLHEFGALLSFLAPNVFTDLSLFDAAFNLRVTTNHKKHHNKSDEEEGDPAATAQQIDRTLLESAHYMMKPFVLRRLKSEVEQKLPPKYETRINCPMTPMQKDLTRALLYKESALISRLDSNCLSGAGGYEEKNDAYAGVTGAGENIDKSKLMSLLAQLRKASNHPYLFDGVEKVAVDGLPTEEIVAASGKMQVLDKLLSKLYAKGHRVVLFSQYTRTLDILSDYLDMRGYKHSRLDGSTNRVMREVKINLFNKPQSPQFIFCLSTRAGGEGVNLFTADTVILYDSDWNPQVDVQAMARVHRIGQTKIVHVYRLVTAGSVEECIVQRAQRKLFLDGMVNRGSTAQAQHEAEQAKLQQQQQQQQEQVKDSTGKRKRSSVGSKQHAEEADDDDEVHADAVGGAAAEPESEESEPSKVLSAVRFGWNSVFSVDSAANKQLSDVDIERIIDRTRGGAATASATGAGVGSEEEAGGVQVVGADGWQENQEYSLHTFDEHAPLVSIRDLKVIEATDADTAPKLPSTVDLTTTDADKATTSVDNADTITTLTMARPKRNISSRTVDMMVEGLGIIKVSKDSIEDEAYYHPNNSTTTLLDKRAARQREQSAVLFISHSGRQVAGRDFEHQDICNECWDGGDLIVCDMCPMAFHLDCIGLKCMPKGNIWFCPHHSCATCARRVSAAALLFRCECCSSAYCEDCLPAEAVVQGESHRLAKLGYRMSGNSCYILCSLECKHFFETEIEKPTEVIAPHQRMIVGEYEHDYSKNNTRKVTKPSGVENDSEDGAVGDISLSNDTYTTNDGHNNNLNTATTLLTSIEHALNNCALDDIHDRLGYPKTTVIPTIPEYLYHASVMVRFKGLGEIPNFGIRLHKTTVSVKSLLYKLISDIMVYQEKLLKKSKAGDNSADVADSDTNSSNSSSDVAATAGGSDALNMTNITKAITEHSGIDVSHSAEAAAKVFLHTVGTLARAQKFTVFTLAECLGLSFVTPLLRTGSVKVNPESEAAAHNAKYMYEPKFSPIKEFNRQKLEEAIAALLVLPVPQNLLIQKSSIDKLPVNALPVDNILIVSRFLESLGEPCVDGNSQFFASLTVKSRGIQQLRHWTPSYPQGYPANQVTKNQWLAPAVRMFAKLKHPPLWDKALRQTLLAVARALAPPAAVPMKTLAGTATNMNGTGNHANSTSNGAYGSTQTYINGGTDSYGNYGNPGSSGSTADLQANLPQLTSTQEKSLFMRWLNEKYDAVEQINDIAAATPPTTTATSEATNSDSNTEVTNLAPRFHVPVNIRQQISIAISTHLRNVLTNMPAQTIIECVRDCEYALLLKARSAEEYTNADTLVRRIAGEVSQHPEWNITAVCKKNNKSGVVDTTASVVDLTSDPLTATSASTSTIANPAPHPTAWRSEITETIRQDMIERVEKMLRLVSAQLRINSLDDLNHKIQQYEMGLVMSATCMREYLDKNTLPRRLAGLVTDFDEYKKSLSPEQWFV